MGTDVPALPLEGFEPDQVVAVSSRDRAPLASDGPVARVCVLVQGPGGVFDYGVPEDLGDVVVRGARVRVRFRGSLADAVVLGRCDEAEHSGALETVQRVSAQGPPLPEEFVASAEAVASLYAASLSDVFRVAVTPRHAGGEQQGFECAPSAPSEEVGPLGAWARYSAGEALLRRLSDGSAVRVAVTCPPSGGLPLWPAMTARAVQAVAAGGRRSVVVVPTSADVDAACGALEEALGAGAVVRLTADDDARDRSASFARALMGGPLVVVGTRSAVWAPLPDVGAFFLHDAGSEHLRERRSPYSSADVVASVRARAQGASVVCTGLVHAAECYVSGRDVVSMAPDASTVVGEVPRVQVTGDPTDRDPGAGASPLPRGAVEVLRRASTKGPCLVVSPTRDASIVAWCASCGAEARCTSCGGAVRAVGVKRLAVCSGCGAKGFACAECGCQKVVAVSRGVEEAAERVRLALPGLNVTARSGGRSGGSFSAGDVVVATPGSFPAVPGGYMATMLMHASKVWERVFDDADFSALRLVATLGDVTAPARRGGVLMVESLDGQGLVDGIASWCIHETGASLVGQRAELGMPPAVPALVCEQRFDARYVAEAARKIASDVVSAFASSVALGCGVTAECLGPMESADGKALRMLVRPGLGAGEPPAYWEERVAAEAARTKAAWRGSKQGVPSYRLVGVRWARDTVNTG